MDMPAIAIEEVHAFILAFIRVCGIIIAIPVLGNRTVPLRVKGGLAIVVTLLVTPFVPARPLPTEMLSLILAMAGEVCIGLTIGLVVRFVFEAMQLAGQIIGFQMGFAIVNVVDPISSAQVSIIAQFVYLIAVLVFFAVNGHHLFLYAIAESFRIIPTLDFHMSGALANAVVTYSKEIFVIAIKIGAPVMAMLVLTSVGLGMVARTVPQINIFIVGFPLKIGIGLVGLGLTLPLIVRIISYAFSDLDGTLKGLMKLM